MREDLTALVVVLDESGSMDHLKNDTIGSFNDYIEKQKKAPGSAVVSLTTFNNSYKMTYQLKDICQVPLLDSYSYSPSGMTALYDAVGATIINVGQSFEKMCESDRPSKVMFVIITDGDENYSREFNQSKVSEMIKHQTEKYNWQFIFIGTDNLDVKQYAKTLNIDPLRSVAFTASAQGYESLSRGLDMVTTSYRMSVDNNVDMSLLKNEVNKSKTTTTTSAS